MQIISQLVSAMFAVKIYIVFMISRIDSTLFDATLWHWRHIFNPYAKGRESSDVVYIQT